jgi:hypothetical protein
VERRPAFPLRRRDPPFGRGRHDVLWSAGAGNCRSRRVPIDLFADRGHRRLDLLAFGFVADQRDFQGARQCYPS